MNNKLVVAVLMASALSACGGTPSLLDPAFGTRGTTVTAFPCSRGGIPAALVKVSTGYVSGGIGCDSWAMVGYTETGALDPSFGDAGVATLFPGESFLSGVESMLVRSDGRLLVGGYRDAGHTLRQLSPTGKVDDAFTAATASDFDAYFRLGFAMALQTDGNLVVAQRESVLRLKPEGTRDPTFGAGGAAFVSLFGKNTSIDRVLAQADGHIVLVGTDISNTGSTPTLRQPFVARLTSKGELDTTFGTNGVFKLPAPAGGDHWVRAAVVQEDGKVILAGSEKDSSFVMQPVLWRLTAAGAMDSTFGTNGLATGLTAPQGGAFPAVSVLSNGTIVAAGRTQRVEFEDSWQVARFTSAGVLDTTFGVAGTTVFDVDMPLIGGIGGATAIIATPSAYVVAGRALKSGSRDGDPLVQFGIARVVP
jgi:uncharacterized delta-60 repeat protein